MRTLPRVQQEKLDRSLAPIFLETGLHFTIPRLGPILMGPKYFASVASPTAVHDLGTEFGFSIEKMQGILADDPDNLPMNARLTTDSRRLDQSLRYRSDSLVVSMLNDANVLSGDWDRVHKVLMGAEILPVSEEDTRIPAFVPPDISRYFEDANITHGVHHTWQIGVVVGWMMGEDKHDIRRAATAVGDEINAAIGTVQFSPAFIEDL